ncbi:MAG: hypothetical protein JXR48_13790 [Candidatus Delongbacteria bacterium]|nr:hypothetical protein [Candidatus Delongbacteria bacterium]MBN2836028.1 hypothetical protein [Candidatus Delongbacteria bacterium]
MIVYLHDFNASPSEKLIEELKEIDSLVLSPFMDYYNPEKSFAELDKIIKDNIDYNPVLTGFGLGGYFAFNIAGKYRLKSALFNPILKPWNVLRRYQGEKITNNKIGKNFKVSNSFTEELENLNYFDKKQRDTIVFLDIKNESGIDPFETYEEVKDFCDCYIIDDSSKESSWIQAKPFLKNFMLEERIFLEDSYDDDLWYN